ncbi:hypothetical protein DIPPA_02126 [Diplonema papillatum]|nr:hypothetical protein DIPPA_32052 [Diplonema papillatum]KAJ9469656.1 hypothetical protein DIPPA_02126 [Diplonema papillatum]
MQPSHSHPSLAFRSQESKGRPPGGSAGFSSPGSLKLQFNSFLRGPRERRRVGVQGPSLLGSPHYYLALQAGVDLSVGGAVQAAAPFPRVTASTSTQPGPFWLAGEPVSREAPS